MDLTKSVLDNITDTWLSQRAKQVAAREALGMVSSARKAKNKKPKHRGKKIIISSAIAEIQQGKNSFDFWLRIHSIGNKLSILLPLKDHRHNQRFRDWKRCTSMELTKEYIQVAYETKTEPKKVVGYKIGIDIGLKHLVATSDEQLYGNDIERLIQKLNHKKRGSKAWYRCKKEIRYYIDITLKNLPWNVWQLVVVENLKNLKHKMRVKRRLTLNIRRVITHWNYRYVLRRMLGLSGENRVVYRSVSPYKTSITCNLCGYCDERNRINQELFRCLNCGHEVNADINAARNIRDRFLTGRYGAGYQTESAGKVNTCLQN